MSEFFKVALVFKAEHFNVEGQRRYLIDLIASLADKEDRERYILELVELVEAGKV